MLYLCPMCTGEQRLLQLPISQQAVQGASPHSKTGMTHKQWVHARTDCFAAHDNKLANDVVAAVDATSLQEQEGEDTSVAAVCPTGTLAVSATVPSW